MHAKMLSNDGLAAKFIRYILACLGLSAASLAFLSLAQLAWLSSSSFLGSDTSTLSWSFASLYPQTALFEVLKLHAYVGLWLFFAILFARAAFIMPHPLGRIKSRKHSKSTVLCFAALPFISYGLFAVGALVHYPGLYEKVLPAGLQSLLFSASFSMNPHVFKGFALAGCCLSIYHSFGKWNLIMPVRLGFLAALALSLVLGQFVNRPWWPKATSQSTQHPLIMIAVDSLRYDRSQDPNRMPHLQNLMSDTQSVVWHDHFVGTPRTFPSWIETLQGKYAANTGIRHMFPQMARRRYKRADLARVLRASGYDTSVFADFAGDIFPRFENGFSLQDSPKLDIPTLIRLSIDQAFPLYLPLISHWPGESFFPDLRESPNFADPFKLTERLLKHVNSQAGTPFFATVFFSTSHFPYAAPWPWYQHFADRTYRGKYYFQKNPALHDDSAQLSEADIRQVRSLYDGSVAAVDAAIGELVAALKKAGLYEQTMLVVTADHGEDLYEKGLLQGHGEHLRGEQVLKVPLLIKLPKALQPQQTNLRFISRSVDVMPTVLSLLGVQAPGQLDGRDLSPWIFNKNPEPPQLGSYSETGLWFAAKGSAFFQKERLAYPGISQLLQFDPGHTGDIILNPHYENLIITAKHRSYTKGSFKLIYSPTPQGAQLRLYQRELDPQNTRDVKVEFPTEFSALKSEFFALIASLEGYHHLLNDMVVPK